MKVTIADIAPVLNALRKAGFKPQLVGSIGRQGWSAHDADIILPYEGASEVVDDPMDVPEYARYVRIMEKLGFSNSGCGTFDREDAEGAGEESTVEAWHKGDLVIDVFPQIRESGSVGSDLEVGSVYRDMVADIARRRRAKRTASGVLPGSLQSLR